LALLAVGLPGSSWAQNPWDAAEETPTPDPSETPEAEPTEPPEASTPGIPEPPTPTPEPHELHGSGFANLGGMEMPVRVLLVILLLIVGYCLPTIFYSSMLRSTTMGPGPAAGLCLAIGGILTMWTIPWLFARIDYIDGVRVPWFVQWENWAWAGGYMAVFVLLAVVAAVSRGGQR